MQFEQHFKNDINRAYFHDSSLYPLTPSPFPSSIFLSLSDKQFNFLLCDFCLPFLQDEFLPHNFYSWFRSLVPDKFSSVSTLMKQVDPATSRLSPPTTWMARSSYLYPPGTGFPVIPPGTGFPFRRLL